MDVRVRLWRKLSTEEFDAFELWCWTRLLRVPWTARRSNQSILKELSPGIYLEGMMLKLKLQYFGHLMWRADSLKKTLMLGGIGGRRRGDDRGWDGWMASLTRWTWVWVNSGSCWWTGRPGVLWFMRSQRVGHDWATELNWTEFDLILSQDLLVPSLHLTPFFSKNERMKVGGQKDSSEKNAGTRGCRRKGMERRKIYKKKMLQPVTFPSSGLKCWKFENIHIRCCACKIIKMKEGNWR